MNYRSITFYKYFQLKDLDEIRQPLRDLMYDFDVKGKIIISNEGINGAICGEAPKVYEFVEECQKFFGLTELSFRDTLAQKQCFKRTLVKIRDELVPLGIKGITPNTAGGGKPLPPEELMKWYEKEEDFLILDTRNDYEAEVGTFKDSIVPDVHQFRDFKNAIKELEDKKDKKIVMFCTGGIRCEKASALLKKEGFENVYKLDGGIIEFMKLENSEKYFKGKLFVFDHRWEIDADQTRI